MNIFDPVGIVAPEATSRAQTKSSVSFLITVRFYTKAALSHIFSETHPANIVRVLLHQFPFAADQLGRMV